MRTCYRAVVLTLIMFFGMVMLLEAAEIISLKGKVEVQRGQDQTWKLAAVGTQLNVGDSLRTARGSSADILLEPATKNFLRVQPSTLIILNSKTPGEVDRIDLSSGKIYANMEKVKAGLTFEVHTPSAVAGVRGTGWSVESDKNVDEAATYENNIYLQSYDANGNMISEITVPEGFKSFIERFQGPSALIELTTDERRDWDSLREDVGSRVEEAGARRGDGGGRGPEKTVEQTQDEVQQSLEQINELQETTAEKVADIQDLIEEKNIEDIVKDQVSHDYSYH